MIIITHQLFKMVLQVPIHLLATGIIQPYLLDRSTQQPWQTINYQLDSVFGGAQRSILCSLTRVNKNRRLLMFRLLELIS
jgi:hypothetical protein